MSDIKLVRCRFEYRVKPYKLRYGGQMEGYSGVEEFECVANRVGDTAQSEWLQLVDRILHRPENIEFIRLMVVTDWKPEE